MNLSDNISEVNNSLHEHSFNAQLSTADFILEVGILILIILIGGSGNGMLLIYNIFYNKNRKKTYVLEILIISSSLADFLMCVLYLPIQVYSLIGRSWDLGSKLCTTHYALLVNCTAVSQCCNLFMAIFCCIKCVIKPVFELSNVSAVLAVIAVWIYTFLLLQVPFITGFVKVTFQAQKDLVCTALSDPNFRQYYFMCIYPTSMIPCVCAILLYTYLLIAIRKVPNVGVMARNKKAAKAMAGIFAIFLLCILPANLLRLVQDKIEVPGNVVRYCLYFFYLNVALNPLYYMYRIRSLVPEKLLKLLSTQILPVNDHPVPLTTSSRT